MNTRPIPFRGFDENAEFRVYYHGRLPHWRQAGCSYFVTFRQKDALPRAVIREFVYERNLWLTSRGIESSKLLDGKLTWNETVGKLPKADQRLYERTMGNKLNKYLDSGYGSCVLKRPELGEVVANSLEFFHKQRVWTGDYVIMPNHVHALMRPMEGFELEEVLQTVKSYSATIINRILNSSGRFWMRESYDHIVRDFDQLDAFQKYISLNPVKAGLSDGQFVLRSATFRPDEG